MMFSDEEVKDPERFIRPGDELISIRSVCLNEKFNKKGFQNEPMLATSSKNFLDTPRPTFRDFFLDGPEQQQASFVWTEEDGNIASFVSESGFGITGQTTFGKELDAAIKSELKEADTSSSVLKPANRKGYTFARKSFPESQLVSSTSSGFSGANLNRPKKGPGACKVDKTDPRSKYHYVKYVKRQGKTIKLWECGICNREFQHQYTLLRHLPTHTDERNFHCDECGKSFRQLSTLSQHRAIHSAERPYSCEMCSKTFNRVSTLISHRKTHSDEKPYCCHICNKGFHQKGNLRNHLFTHTNERPYRCNICLKGFNQQSNLVCHKNKAHPEENCVIPARCRNTRSIPLSVETRPDSTRPLSDHCEVTSSVGPYLPVITMASWVPKEPDWQIPDSQNFNVNLDNFQEVAMNNGVIVDPIKTYHMGVAMATNQTPFALLKPETGNPVLVKVLDTTLPGGKQMLVPATAEDLRMGGKIVVNNDNQDCTNPSFIMPNENLEAAVQIRVPVVATVVPKMKPDGRLHLAVEEPHHAYHTALTTDVNLSNAEPCTSRDPKPASSMPRLKPRPNDICNNYGENILKNDSGISSSCVLPPSPPSPPLEFISSDFFESMEFISLGSQITPVENTQPPPSDDSDIFIGQFEEIIPLSDSD